MEHEASDPVARHGTRHDAHDGRLVRIVDRTGMVWAELTWRGDQLGELRVPGARVRGEAIEDPLLGAAHAIVDDTGAVRTTMSAITWAAPTEIPAVAAPGALPAAAGGAILNAIAILAARAGVSALRYAGPYPTSALYHALLRSFRTSVDEAAFTANALDRAMRLARDPLPFDFTPAPHERVAHAHGFCELRDELERVVIDDTTYARDGSPARLVPDDAGAAAEIWFGDRVYARVASFRADGTLREGPHPIPACTSDVLGREFPLALRGAIAVLVADAVPAALASDVQQLLATTPLHWADLGARAARHDARGFTVHAALWDRLAPLGMGRLALALAEALAPVATGAVVRALMSGR